MSKTNHRPNPDVVLIAEHVSRELDVAAIIKYYAARDYDVHVDILPMDQQYDAQRKLRPKVVCLPFSYSRAGYQPGWWEATYFNLAWEQLIYEAFRREKAPSDEFSRKYVIHHAWGEFHKQFLLENGVPEEHIFLNGQPSYKLYDPPYSNSFVTRQELALQYGLNPNKPWVFFPENYGWGFYTEERLQELIARGLDPAVGQELQDYCLRSFRVVMPWCAEVARSGHVEVVVRPRPATPIDKYAHQLNSVLGDDERPFHLIKSGSVREWVLASDVVLSSYSTTLIEAAVSGKKAYIVEPIPMPNHLAMEWHNRLVRLRSRDEFVEACIGSEAVSGPELGVWARNTMLSCGDPLKNLASFLAQLCLGSTVRPPIVPFEILPEFRRPDHARPKHRRLLSSIRKIAFPGVADQSKLPSVALRAKTDSVFTNADVDERVARWRQTLAATSS